MQESQERLVALVRALADDTEVWEQGELHLLQAALRSRLSELGVPGGRDVAVALMGVALLLAEWAPEWGGDARDCLGELARLGLSLLDEPRATPPAS